MQEIGQELKQTSKLKKPWILTAWSVLLLLVGFIFYSQAQPAPQPQSESLKDPAGLLIMQLQTQYLLGVSALTGDQGALVAQAQILDTGTVDQRQRFMALMISIGEVESAKQSSLKLQDALKVTGLKLDETQEETQKLLNLLIAGEDLPINSNLEEQLGWFGALLLATPTELEEIADRESSKVLVIASTVLFLLCFGLIGFVILVYSVIRTFPSRHSMGPSMLRHGFYAEVFSLWLISFLILMSVVYLISKSDIVESYPLLGTGLTLSAFFGSLSVLLWARFRGITWQQIREDIGWHCGKGFWKELAWGVVGYGMTLPILCCGLLITIVLMSIQNMMLGGPDDNLLHGTGGGSHPIIVEIANGGWALRIGLICLAAIAAPVVEETMFRGVLYRQLRSSMQGTFNESFTSVCLSMSLVSFIFAAIHPQGWVAIPVLMSIAIGMNLLREQRGSIIAPMVIHGINNGLVTALMIYFVSQ